MEADRTMRKFFAVAMGSVVALVGFAGAAHATRRNRKAPALIVLGFALLIAMLLGGTSATADGPVIDWGKGIVPAGQTSAISVGHYHSCAIDSGTGAVFCWGKNNEGQATPPAAVDGTVGTASAIGAGYEHS
jgi:hypothetical protein